jgi:hypothetical protein
MSAMMKISFLAESDRAEWAALARDYKAFFEVEADDDDYEQAFRRLADGEQARGIAARVNGRMAGLAHYYFHVSVWSPRRTLDLAGKRPRPVSSLHAPADRACRPPARRLARSA